MDIPRTALCDATLQYAASLYSPCLFNHATRSYLFAHALAEQAGAKHDSELLYVACLLHDMGLTEAAPVNTRFEVEGADMATTFLASHGLAPAQQTLVWDAIALHTTNVIPQRKAPEIAFCQLGTAIDVGYAPCSMLPPPLILEVVRAYPRLDFKAELVDTLCGLLKRNKLAAASPVVSDVGERKLPGFARLHICDVIAGAAFTE